MTNEEYLNLKERVFKYGKKRGLSTEKCEDFLGHITVSILENPDIIRNIQLSFLKFLDADNKVITIHKTRYRYESLTHSLDAPIKNCDDEKTLFDIIPSQDEYVGDEDELESIKLNDLVKLILNDDEVYLFNERSQGRSCKDLAEIFGVCQAAIWFKIKKMKHKLKDQALLFINFKKYKDGVIQNDFEIDWITL